jgi:hypothetical protein
VAPNNPLALTPPLLAPALLPSGNAPAKSPNPSSTPDDIGTAAAAAAEPEAAGVKSVSLQPEKRLRDADAGLDG